MDRVSFSEFADSLGADRSNVEEIKEQMRAAVEEQKLRDVRKAMDMTQKELASEIGVAQNRISDIENGRVESLKIDTLKRYARALGFDVDIFLRPRKDASATTSLPDVVKLAIG